MGYAPTTEYIDPNLATIHTQSLFGSIGDGLIAVSGSSFLSSAYPAVSRALFIPIYINEDVVVKQLWCYNGATVSGNVDMGLFDKYGTMLQSAGSTAQAGTNAVQAFDITDQALEFGVYYLGISIDNTTATIFRGTPSALALRMMGVQETAGLFPLANATYANPTSAFIPRIGLTLNSVI